MRFVTLAGNGEVQSIRNKEAMRISSFKVVFKELHPTGKKRGEKEKQERLLCAES